MIKVRTLIMSHLSDAQVHVGMSDDKVLNHIDFAKFLILKHKNTDVEVDADTEYESFIEKYPTKSIN